MLKNKNKKTSKTRLRLFIFFSLAIIILCSAIGFEVAKGRTQIEYALILVRPGDNLWNIAQKHYPKNQDLRKSVWEIRKINNLDSANIKPGQVLKIPVN